MLPLFFALTWVFLKELDYIAAKKVGMKALLLNREVRKTFFLVVDITCSKFHVSIYTAGSECARRRRRYQKLGGSVTSPRTAIGVVSLLAFL